MLQLLHIGYLNDYKIEKMLHWGSNFLKRLNNLDLITSKKILRILIPPKKIDYADFLVYFGLLYRDTLEFNLPSEKHDFLKNKLYLLFHLKFLQL